MGLLFWFIVGIILIELVVIIFIKRKVESKKSLTVKQTVWWIAGTVVWGVASIMFVVWWFNIEFTYFRQNNGCKQLLLYY